MTLDGGDVGRPLPQPGQRSFDRRRRLTSGVQAFAGLLGAAGIATAAAGAHKGGGELVSTASTFMLIHAVAALALGAAANGTARIGGLIAAMMLLVGTVFFAGDLALAGFLDWRPFPLAAPIGGMLLLIGWLAIPAVMVVEGLGLGRR